MSKIECPHCGKEIHVCEKCGHVEEVKKVEKEKEYIFVPYIPYVPYVPPYVPQPYTPCPNPYPTPWITWTTSTYTTNKIPEGTIIYGGSTSVSN